ncbi:SMI1/KNR4 family protein [Spirillospora sp. NPDC029432]|uniref:SMI1/KNR4 family protein n=1 Tax=Spirillospora sp. NPDC029432 TaxID=3154599 RepID=UPI0034553440
MWTELIGRLYGDAEFAAPAADEAIDRILPLGGVPDDLRELLRQTDGVRAEYGSGLVWSVQEIIEGNAEFRRNPAFAELYAPFDRLLFMADNGGGDQFAYVQARDDRPGGIVVWDHETDEREPVAVSLRDYLERRAASEGDDWYR